MIWRGFGAWQNGDKHVTNSIEMWQNFRHMPETAQPRGLCEFGFCHIFVPDVTNFVTIVWCIKVFCHKSYRNGDFVMTNFVTSLSHLTGVMIKFVPFLSPVCHILYVLWQNLSNFCPQFVTSPTNFVQFLSHFWIFIHFLYIKCIFWRFVPFLSPFLSHGTNFVTFLAPQKPSNTKGFHDWSKICHIFSNFVPSLSRVCHVHKPRGYTVYT